MLKHLESIKSKSELFRRNVALVLSLLITIVIAMTWIFTSDIFLSDGQSAVGPRSGASALTPFETMKNSLTDFGDSVEELWQGN